MNDKFTAEQLADWQAYEEVRSGGRFNMIMDRMAMIASGLTPDRYLFVMANYEALMNAVNNKQTK